MTPDYSLVARILSESLVRGPCVLPPDNDGNGWQQLIDQGLYELSEADVCDAIIQCLLKKGQVEIVHFKGDAVIEDGTVCVFHLQDAFFATTTLDAHCAALIAAYGRGEA